MLYPNFFYSDQSSISQILTAELHIDKIENYCTEDRRVAYNNKNPTIPLSKKYIEDPPALVYHVSKPIIDWLHRSFYHAVIHSLIQLDNFISLLSLVISYIVLHLCLTTYIYIYNCMLSTYIATKWNSPFNNKCYSTHI